MPWNLLLLPLLGGYLFLYFCHRCRFHSQRLEGYRLLIESAICGVFLAGLARLITLGVGLFSWGRTLEGYCATFLPFQFAGTGVTALLLGLALPRVVNWWISEKRAKVAAIDRLADPLLKLLYVAAEHRRPVYVTLDTRKVYVGYVLNAPNLEPENVHVGILPLLSGYRDLTGLGTHFTVDYIEVYKSDDDVNPNDFLIAIPLAHIRSVHYFDLNIYVKFFSEMAEEDRKELEQSELRRKLAGDLVGADLAGADLEEADLKGANLKGANLAGGTLTRARLEGANLERANLKGANLEVAKLVEANLREADLRGADLATANLEGASLVGAYLAGANLFSANLRRTNLVGAIGLTQGQLSYAFGDNETKLPEDLQAPGHWPPPDRAPAGFWSNSIPTLRF